LGCVPVAVRARPSNWRRTFVGATGRRPSCVQRIRTFVLSAPVVARVERGATARRPYNDHAQFARSCPRCSLCVAGARVPVRTMFILAASDPLTFLEGFPFVSLHKAGHDRQVWAFASTPPSTLPLQHTNPLSWSALCRRRRRRLRPASGPKEVHPFG
jgi:hypothetical protein